MFALLNCPFLLPAVSREKRRGSHTSPLPQAELLSYKPPDRSCTHGLHWPGFFPALCLCVGRFPGLQRCLLLLEVLVTMLQGGCCCLQWGSRGVLPLPQHGVSPAPHTACGAGWAHRCFCSSPALLGCWRAACSGHFSLRASGAAAARTLEACRLLAGIKWMVFSKAVLHLCC